MTDEISVLKRKLAHDLPPDFVRDLRNRAGEEYRAAYARAQADAKLDERHIKYVAGFLRWTYFEAALRDLATRHDELQVSMQSCTDDDLGQSLQHVLVLVGCFALTQCHVQSAGALPRPSRWREQYSQINARLDRQCSLLPHSPASLDAEHYGIIVHASRPSDHGELGSIGIGFPNREFDDWIGNRPVQLKEIMLEQGSSLELVETTQPAAPRPRWKRRPTSKRGR